MDQEYIALPKTTIEEILDNLNSMDRKTVKGNFELINKIETQAMMAAVNEEKKSEEQK